MSSKEALLYGYIRKCTSCLLSLILYCNLLMVIFYLSSCSINYLLLFFVCLCLGTLPYLFQTLFVLDSGLAPLIIQLIHAALSGTPPVKADDPTPEPEIRTSRRKKDVEALRAKEKEKSKTKESKVSVVGKPE